MRPFTVLIGIVLGSAASITFGLAAVLVVFVVLAILAVRKFRPVTA